jgi:hypothetical protein
VAMAAQTITCVSCVSDIRTDTHPYRGVSDIRTDTHPYRGVSVLSDCPDNAPDTVRTLSGKVSETRK